jgi:hypothetical protein
MIFFLNALYQRQVVMLMVPCPVTVETDGHQRLPVSDDFPYPAQIALQQCYADQKNRHYSGAHCCRRIRAHSVQADFGECLSKYR